QAGAEAGTWRRRLRRGGGAHRQRAPGQRERRARGLGLHQGGLARAAGRHGRGRGAFVAGLCLCGPVRERRVAGGSVPPPRPRAGGDVGARLRREWVLGWESRLLVVLTAVLVVFGLASVYAASGALIERGRLIGSTRMLDQLVGAIVGALLLVIAARVNLDRV